MASGTKQYTFKREDQKFVLFQLENVHLPIRCNEPGIRILGLFPSLKDLNAHVKRRVEREFDPDETVCLMKAPTHGPIMMAQSIDHLNDKEYRETKLLDLCKIRVAYNESRKKEFDERVEIARTEIAQRKELEESEKTERDKLNVAEGESRKKIFDLKKRLKNEEANMDDEEVKNVQEEINKLENFVNEKLKETREELDRRLKKKREKREKEIERERREAEEKSLKNKNYSNPYRNVENSTRAEKKTTRAKALAKEQERKRKIQRMQKKNLESDQEITAGIDLPWPLSLQIRRQNVVAVSFLQDVSREARKGQCSPEHFIWIWQAFVDEDDANEWVQQCGGEHVTDPPIDIIDMYEWFNPGIVDLSRVKEVYPDERLTQWMQQHKQQREDINFFEKWARAQGMSTRGITPKEYNEQMEKLKNPANIEVRVGENLINEEEARKAPMFNSTTLREVLSNENDGKNETATNALDRNKKNEPEEIDNSGK
jgi:hypothetical protein